MPGQGWRVAAGVALLATGCAHSHSTPKPPGRPEPGVVQDTAGFTVATSPAGLFHAGSERQIQERLVARGLLDTNQVTGRLDDPTEAALRRFQASSDLAETGLPSYGTVERLGLDPERIFRARGAAPDSRAPPR